MQSLVTDCQLGKHNRHHKEVRRPTYMRVLLSYGIMIDERDRESNQIMITSIVTHIKSGYKNTLS